MVDTALLGGLGGFLVLGKVQRPSMEITCGDREVSRGVPLAKFGDKVEGKHEIGVRVRLGLGVRDMMKYCSRVEVLRNFWRLVVVDAALLGGCLVLGDVQRPPAKFEAINTIVTKAKRTPNSRTGRSSKLTMM